MRLRKLYLDCVDAEGGVCIAYVSQLRGFGMQLAPAGIERYEPDGTRSVQRGVASLSLAQAPQLRALSQLRFALAARECRIELTPEQTLHVPTDKPPHGLDWRVQVARARVLVRDLRCAGDVLEGVGYADYVELTRSLRALGLSQLEWGRVHLAGGSLIYCLLTCLSGPNWRSVTFWPSAASPQHITDFRLVQPPQRDHCAGSVTRQLCFSLPQHGPLSVELSLLRPLHQGAAVDNARFPSWLERMVSRAVAGPTRELRFVSRAHCAALGDGYAVHESVSFGRAALAARSRVEAPA